MLLESGRNPRVSLHNHEGTRVTSVFYLCTQALDGCKESCVIRKQLKHRCEMESWLQRLPRPSTWNAEALPAVTHKVLNELLKD